MAELKNAARKFVTMVNSYRGEPVVGGSGMHRLMKRIQKALGGRLPDYAADELRLLVKYSTTESANKDCYNPLRAETVAKRLQSWARISILDEEGGEHDGQEERKEEGGHPHEERTVIRRDERHGEDDTVGGVPVAPTGDDVGDSDGVHGSSSGS